MTDRGVGKSDKCAVIAYDDMGRWAVFNRADALGDFRTWQEASDFAKANLGDDTIKNDAPAWTPKSGGY